MRVKPDEVNPSDAGTVQDSLSLDSQRTRGVCYGFPLVFFLDMLKLKAV